MKKSEILQIRAAAKLPATISQAQARRFAKLIAHDMLNALIDTADDWSYHPETDKEFSFADARAIRKAAREIWKRDEDRKIPSLIRATIRSERNR